MFSSHKLSKSYIFFVQRSLIFSGVSGTGFLFAVSINVFKFMKTFGEKLSGRIISEIMRVNYTLKKKLSQRNSRKVFSHEL